MKFEGKISALHDDRSQLEYLMIINERSEGGNNYLHSLVNKMTTTNYSEINEMTKTILINHCNPNTLNDQQETPFSLLLKKLQSLGMAENDLVLFFIEKSDINFNSHSDIARIMEKRGLRDKIIVKPNPIKNLNFMSQNLSQFNESAFISEFENFKAATKLTDSDLQNDIDILFGEAIIRNMSQATKLLMDNGANINEISQQSRFELPPAFLACSLGYHQVLKVLLTDPYLLLTNKTMDRNLLHEVLVTEKLHASDRQKCFELLISDHRCSLETINSYDEHRESPLSYACQLGLNEITSELLRRGAYIGHVSVIENVDKKVLEEFLDECVCCSSEVNDKSSEISIDYRFLMPPDKSQLEVHAIDLIAGNSNLRMLLQHPVISTFFFYKWRRVKFFAYFNLIAYFSFMLFLSFFMIRFFSQDFYVSRDTLPSVYTMKNETLNREIFRQYKELNALNNTAMTSVNNVLSQIDSNASIVTKETGVGCRGSCVAYALFGKRRKRSINAETSVKTRLMEYIDQRIIYYRICIYGAFLIAVYEIIQCLTSIKKYFFTFGNWLDISLIVLCYVVLLRGFDIEMEYFMKIRVITMLVMAAQSLKLASKVPAFSMSLHMMIFKKVCVTLLKTLALYFVLILAFAMSFYSLHDKDSNQNFRKNENFSSPLISILSTIRMMQNDFQLLHINPKDHFVMYLSGVFIFLITIVIVNLLNALAIRDTNEVMGDAEFIYMKKSVSILIEYEKLFSLLKLSFANVFPEMESVIINKNKKHVSKNQQHMNEEKIVATNSGDKKLFSLFNKKPYRRTKKQTLNICDWSLNKILQFVEAQEEKNSSKEKFDELKENYNNLNQHFQSLKLNIDTLLDNRSSPEAKSKKVCFAETIH